MGLTLLEAAKGVQDPLTSAVIAELTEGELMRTIPFQNVPGSGVFYSREGELPAVGFRGFNEGNPDGYGVLNPQSEGLRIFGGDLDVDLAQIDMYGEQTRGIQTQMKVRAMRMTFEDKFINGDSETNPREMDGLKTRLGEGSSQYIDNGGGPLSLAALDQLIDEVDSGGQPKYLIMPKAMRRRLSQAARTQELSGCLLTDRNEMGKIVTRYGDVEILITDKNSLNQDIQGFNESGNTTSVYCVAFGDMLTTGIQGQHSGQYGISVRDLGEAPDKPAMRTRMDWYIGMAIYNGRSVARLAGVTNAAVVA